MLNTLIHAERRNPTAPPGAAPAQGRFRHWTAITRMMVLSAAFAVLLPAGTAEACNPDPNSCCWEGDGSGGHTGWLTCAGNCDVGDDGITICEQWAHPPPDYWADSRTKPLSLTTLQRKYPEVWRNMKARGSQRRVEIKSR